MAMIGRMGTSEPAPTLCVQAKKEGVGAMIGQPVRPSPAAQGGLPTVGNFTDFGASASVCLLGSPARVGRR